MSFFKEFKEFATKGNVMDLAVGVIIGGAFQKIVTSLVDNIFMPVLGIVTGGINFKDKFWLLNTSKGTDFPSLEKAKEAGAPVFAYGAFVQSIIDFILIAFCIFLLVKFMNSMRKKKEAAPAAPPAPTNEEKLLMEIRDALKNK
ncbi:large conductance mechanosensitive channel [Chitinophaga sp. YR627]|jgi:large conductance mechanosensitive channel|uniref:Large-conductance mechanosensitive channel n=1 Tax=Chitinophaga pinensis (strain ATCC 43595 / DSM 2588 / LMG 13176 / NBRC 15968 / NCIMB 11800 / UQM 2034) TaxID=485918 RepID=A0A979FZ89_CHIPD|nr:MULTISPECIES: large conductance mechanosensitive channel protein MscL [Chitinophaga]ACU57885.1 large conductance mechanosensitive channel protein [Chitinophaga pinensis DSM 2588]SFO35806.1 large conductance mechanosensitive channel [Chitinophaga sp. YR627]